MRVGRLLVLPACLLLQACAGGSTTAVHSKPSAVAQLSPTAGSFAEGTVKFTQKGDRVEAEADVRGLTPNSAHGFHIHENGDCSAPDASSAGAHFDPTASAHGGPGGEIRHGGDLGNLTADGDGNARGKIGISGVSIDSGPDRIIGRAIILHASPDDLKSQPAGNSGARIACGIINPTPDEAG
jgi:superoxide dismutase, Cu-Zn family